MKPIWSEEAEQAVLGSMLVGSPVVAECIATLRPEDFWREPHQELFKTMRLMSEVGTPIDMLTLRDELGKDLIGVGGMDYLIQIQETVPSPANAETYAGIVKDKATRRRVQEGAAKISHLAGTDAELSEIRGLMDGLCEGSLVDGPKLTRLSDIAPAQRRQGIPTGFPKIDEIQSCNGYPCGQFSIASAYHKTGKSTWMIQAMVAACKQGYRSIYITVADLSKEDIARKVLKMLCGWDIEPYMPEYRANFLAAKEAVESWDCQVYDASDLEHGTDVETICALLRSENAKSPLGMCCIDYAQELTSSEARGRSEYDEQTACAKKLRIQAARMKECAMLIGSQITEGGKDGRDRTKSTRAWEEKAGWILRMKREGYGDALTLQSAFSRYGGTGREFDLTWNRERESYVS